MKRTSVNPVDWSLAYSMDQGEIVEGATKHLRCSGQISVDPAPDTELGVAVVSPNDLRGQMEHTFRNIDSVLEKAEMGKENIIALRFFTTDIDGFLASSRPIRGLRGRLNRLTVNNLL